MSWLALLTGYGPYYIIGFVITFFSLMGSRYLLGYNIYPQERFVRITMISIGWLPCLIGATIIAYVRRGDKLIAAQDEADILRQRIAELEGGAQDELQEKQVFTDAELDKQAETVEPKSKGLFSW